MKPLVLSYVVDQDLCIGCGVCTALCPDKLLKMEFNKFGEYNPNGIGECIKECGTCMKVCPFADGTSNEDVIGQELFGKVLGIQHRQETGYFLCSYVGYSNVNEYREQGSSGGMATWMLVTLLQKGIVDAVVCVTHNQDSAKLFKFSTLSTVNEVQASSGSAYYPVELSEVITYIIEKPGRYALIGLPCFVKAIRLAMMRNKKLRERIILLLGLTCGQLKSKNYTDYIATLAGLEEAPVMVMYRGKDPNYPANNYFFSCKNEKNEEKKIFFAEGVDEAWVNRWFTPNACNYCDDIFAECADVTFMDAWLPEYTRDWRGANFIIIRSPLVQELINPVQLHITPIPIEKIIKSQQGVIGIKRKNLSYRLFLDKKIEKKHLIQKRVLPKRINDPFQRQQFILKEEMRIASRELWIIPNRNDKVFRRTMQKYLAKGALDGYFMFPLRVLRFFFRNIWRT